MSGERGRYPVLQNSPFVDYWNFDTLDRWLSGYLSDSVVAIPAIVISTGIACVALVKVWRSVRRGAKSRCPWKKDSDQSQGTMIRWKCRKCSGISFTEGSEPPRTCRAYDPRAKSL